VEDFSHNILRTKCIVQLLSASLDIIFYYNFYIKVVIKTSDIKKSKRTKLERTAMITLKKKERGKQKDEKRKKKISGRSRPRHHKRKEKPLFGSIAENSISARLRDWILVLVFCIVCARGPACGAAN